MSSSVKTMVPLKSLKTSKNIIQTCDTNKFTTAAAQNYSKSYRQAFKRLFIPNI